MYFQAELIYRKCHILALLSGRVAYIAHGADKGKLVAIVDVIDQNRALVDGPCSCVGRKDMNFKALHLTPYTIKINHSARTGTVKKAWEAAEFTKNGNSQLGLRNWLQQREELN
ncbi:60S ribosomal protein L14 [Biomphalaria pfeifferi]|uniref:Large ribosomal subunit protein eL14 n=1 Tax=Biomphalaria pfeifferi TaxID=112525 RepID=A0AAD8F4Q4_BIOPF|nr:60S ribosomal protein L14 [Biomphalaria pfeifferi]